MKYRLKLKYKTLVKLRGGSLFDFLFVYFSLKRWFFKNVNKIDKYLARLIKKNRERVQINKIRNEGEVTTDTTKIQRIIKVYYE